MQEIWVLIVLLVLGVPLVLAIWLIVRALKAGNRIEDLSRRLGEVEAELFRLKQQRETTQQSESAPAEASVPKVAPKPAPAQSPAPPIVQREEI